MTIREFVEFMNSPKNKMLKDEQIQAMLAKHLKVKPYLSIKDKKKLVDNIVNECILYEDGMFKFDEMEKYVCFIMKSIEAYTNLELSDDMEDDYDLLCGNNLLNPVIATFNKEYDEVNVVLQMKCDYILSGNSFEAQIGKFLSNVLDKLDSFSDVLAENLGNFDLSKLNIGKDDLAKLMEFVNMNK